MDSIIRCFIYYRRWKSGCEKQPLASDARFGFRIWLPLFSDAARWLSCCGHLGGKENLYLDPHKGSQEKVIVIVFYFKNIIFFVVLLLTIKFDFN